MTSNDLLRRLNRLATRRGWQIEELAGRGSHLKVILNGRVGIVPQHRGDIASGTFRSILKQLGITQTDLEV